MHPEVLGSTGIATQQAVKKGTHPRNQTKRHSSIQHQMPVFLLSSVRGAGFGTSSRTESQMDSKEAHLSPALGTTRQLEGPCLCAFASCIARMGSCMAIGSRDLFRKLT